MHTIPNKVIDKNKIRLLKLNDVYKATDIVEYMVKISDIKFSDKLPFLDRYINDYILGDKK